MKYRYNRSEGGSWVCLTVSWPTLEVEAHI